MRVMAQEVAEWGQDGGDVAEPAMVAMALGYAEYLLDVAERLAANAEAARVQ